MPIFAPANNAHQSCKNKLTEKTLGLVAQLNSASDYGSEGYWFESSRGHKAKWRQLKTIGAIFFHISSKYKFYSFLLICFLKRQ